jgi:hypothetical protein
LLQKGLGKARVAVARKLGIRLWIMLRDENLGGNRIERIHSAHRAMKKIEVRFTDYLEKHGMDDDYLAEKCIKPALEVMETKFGFDKGIVMSRESVIAWGPRLQAIDIVLHPHGSRSHFQALNHAQRNLFLTILLSAT